MKFDCVNAWLFVGRGLAPAVLQSNYEKISLFVCGGSKPPPYKSNYRFVNKTPPHPKMRRCFLFCYVAIGAIDGVVAGEEIPQQPFDNRVPL